VAFKWFEAPSAPAKVTPDVKIGKMGITVTVDALKRVGLDSADRVDLAFDPGTHRIGLRAGSDKHSFKIAPRGRSMSAKFVAASKFYDSFGIDGDTVSVADGKLKEQDGIACFDIKAQSRRGRASAGNGVALADPDAPYGRKKDGTPKARPGRVKSF